MALKIDAIEDNGVVHEDKAVFAAGQAGGQARQFPGLNQAPPHQSRQHGRDECKEAEHSVRPAKHKRIGSVQFEISKCVARPYNNRLHRCSFKFQPMKFLISNDDGIHARGIQVLATRMAEIGEIKVVAPEKNHSGASNSLTLGEPIRVKEIEPDWFRVRGTPSDCVHLALTGLLEADPDIVVSGINYGANLGDDVIYSGTVAAAMEGRFLGLPAIAVSLVFEEEARYFETAANAVAMIVERLQHDPLPADTILNINVPDVPWEEVRGFEVTRLGHRHRAENVIATEDPRGRPLYWIGPAGPGQDAGPGTDFDAVDRRFVSITPIHVDLTRYKALEQVSKWIAGLDLDTMAKRKAV